MDEPAILVIIQGLAPQHDLPWELVAAVCKVESSMNPWAMRYEPAFKWLLGNQDTLNATERCGQMISWGLMQVMGAVAREHGFKGDFPKLCLPEVGLNYGMAHLNKFRRRYAKWSDVIASYNAGFPRMHEGKYYNQTYVDKVLTHWGLLDQSRPKPPLASET